MADVGGAEASVATSGETVYQACKALAGKLQLSSSASSFNLAVAVTDGPYPARLIPLVINGQATLFPDNTSGQVSSMHDRDNAGIAPMTTFTMTRPLPRPLMNPIGAGDAVASGIVTCTPLLYVPLSHTYPHSYMFTSSDVPFCHVYPLTHSPSHMYPPSLTYTLLHSPCQVP